MSITATLIAQIIAFVLLIWFVNKVLWGPLTGMMAERQKRIADGLAASDKGKHELELAERRATEKVQDAKNQAADMLAKAEKRASEIIEESKEQARTEGDRIISAARAEIEQELNRSREQLRNEVAALAVAGAAKILDREVDAKAHQKLIQDLVAQA